MPPSVPGAPAPDGTPQSLQDMLLPAGPASAQPGGAPAAGTPPSLEDMLLGVGGPPMTSRRRVIRSYVLSRSVQPPVVAPQRLNPADIESFKAMARQSMISRRCAGGSDRGSDQRCRRTHSAVDGRWHAHLCRAAAAETPGSWVRRSIR